MGGVEGGYFPGTPHFLEIIDIYPPTWKIWYPPTMTAYPPNFFLRLQKTLNMPGTVTEN